ncbi:macrolide efflux ABC transporter membrane-spanning permease [Streptococcus pneumoniae]|nr:macrolide efflux ABC transporter membrane-spanning permease [Streptococcus pneumoniae]
MNRYAVQLISRGAINKMGNMLYDYGNSVWLASMGTIGQTVLGMYQTKFPEKERKVGSGNPIIKTPTPVKASKIKRL